MSDKATLETVIREIYDARMAGDVDGIMRLMADDVQFSIAGCGASSSIPCQVEGAKAFRDVVQELIATFQFSNRRVLNQMIEGDRAVVHWRAQVKVPKSGAEAETELVDLLAFEGGKVRSFREFADTALAKRLLA